MKKELTVEKVANIFKIERFQTLTTYKYKGKSYQFQFDFKAEEKGERIINIFNIENPNKVVAFFRY